MTESDLLVCAKWYTDHGLLNLVKVEKPDLTLPIILYAAKINNVLVGALDLFNIDIENHKAEFGLCFPVKKGLAWIAARKFLRMAFNAGFNRIYARVLEDNEQVIRMALRAGFKRDGIERQAVYRDGKYLDIVHLSILKKEFIERWG